MTEWKATEQTPPHKRRAALLLLRFLYWIYERRLLNQLKQKPMPRHIGIILDGNRRHARKQGVSDPCEIYQRGAEKLDDILDWCAELGIPAVTLWVFSTENLKRPQAEVSGILSAIEAKVGSACLRSLLASEAHPNSGHRPPDAQPLGALRHCV